MFLITSETVKSVEKALDILLLFNSNRMEISNGDIVKALKCSSSSASRMLNSFVKKEFLAKNDDTDKYHLSNKMYYLSALLRNQLNYHDVFLPHLQNINKITEETAHVFMRDGVNRFCFQEIASPHKIKMTSEIGALEPLWVGCTGRALIAFLPEEKREQIFQSIHEEAPHVDIEQMREKINRVIERGYSTKDGPWDNNCGCVAAPIYDHRRNLVGVLGISTPDFRFPTDPTEYIRLITDTARMMSRDLGYIG